MNKKFDFLMIYPHPDVMAYSQRILLGALRDAGFSVHLANVQSTKGLKSNSSMRQSFLEMVECSRMVGIGFMSNMYHDACYLTELIKSNMDKHVVWGGPHPSISYKKTVGEADALFIGESEITLPAYVKRYFNGEPVDDLPGLVVNSPDDYKVPSMEYSVQDMDSLPMTFYSEDGQTIFMEDEILEDISDIRKHFRLLQVLTTRGCPYKCTFCANSYLESLNPEKTPRLRKKSIPKVMEEIELCRSVYKIGGVSIEDDLFLARKNQELVEFAKLYNERIDLPMGITGVTPNLLTSETAEIIFRMPMTRLRIGIQTASEVALKVYDRKGINKRMDRLISTIKEDLPKNIMVDYDIILDNPYENVENYVETLNFLLTVPKPFKLNMYHLTLYEGTAMRDQAIEDGFIDPNHDYYSRHYGDLDDTYINAIFKLLDSSSGFLPFWALSLLTHKTILRLDRMQKYFLKPVINGIIYMMKKINVGRSYVRFRKLLMGYYNWKWVKVKLRGIGICFW